jgi:excinuclease UvrABC nuclease subunit
VNKISDKDYAQDVKMMSLFLSGKSVQTLDNISQKMQAAFACLSVQITPRQHERPLAWRH